MKEIWKDIPGYEKMYQVSNYGRIKSLNYKRSKNEKIMKEYPENNRIFKNLFMQRRKSQVLFNSQISCTIVFT